jgi:sortase A
MLAELMVGVAFTVAPTVAPAPIEWTPPPTAAKYGTITIPSIDVRAPIRQLASRGPGTRILNFAVGHLPSTSSPGMGSTIGLFGHNVTPMYGQPYGVFNKIDEMKRGSRIIVRMPYGRFTYKVTGHRVIASDAWHVFKPQVNKEQLFLAKCWPDGSAQYRYVVKARED